MLGETVDVVLAENQLAVDDDIKDAAGALDQRGIDVALVLDRSGQTGRSGKVVSLHAVCNRDLHLPRAPLWIK